MSEKAKRFWVRAELVKSVPGFIDTSLVHIFDGDREIGTYERNLCGWSEATFEPFEWEGEWFALYAPDYTSTRVLSLPGCRDLGGEEPQTNGFCPVEFHVPRYRRSTNRNLETGEVSEDWEFGEGNIEQWQGYDRKCDAWTSLPTSFVAGCQWGDDSTWKLQCIDTAMAAQGTIVREARFGHVELAHGQSIAQSVSFDRNPPHWDLRMTLVRQERRDVATGILIDPYNE